MGDPRRLKKKFETPMHPWRAASIEIERELKKEYALKNKQEIWRMDSLLRGFKNQAKRLIALRTVQADKERTQLLKRLQRLGLLSVGARIDEILGLTTKNVMERRLQSFVFRKGLAHSMKQARQFITHSHLMVKDRIVTAPSHIITRSEEELIRFSPRSSLLNPEHPERAAVQAKKEEKTAKEGKETKEAVKQHENMKATQKIKSSEA